MYRYVCVCIVYYTGIFIECYCKTTDVCISLYCVLRNCVPSPSCSSSTLLHYLNLFHPAL